MEIEDLTPHPVGSPTKKAKFGSSQHSDAFSMKRQRVFPGRDVQYSNIKTVSLIYLEL